MQVTTTSHWWCLEAVGNPNGWVHESWLYFELSQWTTYFNFTKNILDSWTKFSVYARQCLWLWSYTWKIQKREVTHGGELYNHDEYRL